MLIFKRFFKPTQSLSLLHGLWFYISRAIVAIASFYLLLTLLFALLPVPFSAYMVQKKIGNLVQGESYSISYDWVSLDKISWQMQMAVIAGEDQKFDLHFGVDIDAIEKALTRNAKTDKKPRGASTISQQTVKNLYLWHGSSWVRKGIELPLTLLVETLWSKSRILEVYLNIAEFGEGIFGVEAAAQHYFKKSADKLTLQESALLAAALPNPILFKVNNPGPTLRKRQQWIMRQIYNLGGQSYLEKL